MVLYVGKAKNLRARIKQYFGHDTRPQIPFLLKQVKSIDVVLVFSEKEALLLENTYIKKHKPKYNMLLKDDRSFIALKLTGDAWPRLDLVRHKGLLPKDRKSFGPFRNLDIARELLDTVHKAFPLRQCSDEEFARRKKPCILYQMKRCIAPCVGLCTKEQYAAQVKDTQDFLSGASKQLIKQLQQQLKTCAHELQFEEAARLRDRIAILEGALETQSVSSYRIGDVDAIAFARGGNLTTIARLIFRGGRLVDVEIQHVHDALEEDSSLLSSYLLQEYLTSQDRPPLVLIPLSIPALEEVFAETGRAIKLSSSRSKPLRQLAQKNADKAFEREREQLTVRDEILSRLQTLLKLERLPAVIECFDNSHLAGSAAVSAVVQYVDGKKNPKGYRTYIIRKAKASDDLGAFEEALTRRFQKNNYPDLLLIDGGQTQLNVACKVLEQLGVATVDVAAIVKEEGRHDKGSTRERLFLPGQKEPLHLPPRSAELFFLQQIRDEAHRFALQFHQGRRSKSIHSALDSIPGIGPIKRAKLLKTFGSVAGICAATDEQLLEIISRKDLVAIRTGLTQ